MLELGVLRNDFDGVRSNLERRRNPELLKLLDKFKDLDKRIRVIKKNVDLLRSERNNLSRSFSKTKDKKLIVEVKKVNDELKVKESVLNGLEIDLLRTRMKIPNLLHDSVPYGKDDEENVEIKRFGTPTKRKDWMKGHEELLVSKGLLDMERARKISGSRYYFLKGKLVKLQMALMNFGLDTLTKKGYDPIIPPFMMRRKPYESVTDLSDFQDVMYKIEDEDSYMIATSEHPIAAMHMNEVIEEKDLPLRYAGFSFNFRKEAGSHGKDTKGIFRAHRFGKVEQLVFIHPDDSYKEHEKMIKISEDFFKKLEFPFRKVNICTGDLGIVAAKKYDLEAWYPLPQKYKEIVSGSNCTTYQSTRLNFKMQKNPGAPKSYLHTLNCTLLTDTRPIVAIVENFQDKNGDVKIPKALQKYTGFSKL